MKTRGKCSYFGGPGDTTGMTATEPLAFIYEVSDQPDLFLPGSTEALGRNLDPSEFYVACRWPYNSETKAAWREALLSRKALVRNPVNGKSAWAFPADWGPHEDTDRVADLSPALLEHLELVTDDEVQVFFPTRQVTLPVAPNNGLPAFPVIAISPGHGLLIRGAAGPSPWGLDEVDSARKVVPAVAEILRQNGVVVHEIEDNVSTTQDANLNYLVNAHNAIEGRDLDISVHLNAFEDQEEKPMGCEVLAESQMELAADVSSAMADALKLPDRGAKDGSGLFFISHTDAPALLLELVFCDAKVDCDSFRENFDYLVNAIADVLLDGQRVS